MPSPLIIAVSLLSGMVLGVIFFGGLWLTVRALPTARHPAALALASFWGRTALVVGSFGLFLAQGWQTVLIGLVGFIVARLLMSRWVPNPSETRRIAE
jgi:F1F0 ATPase subunit 2